MAFCISDAEKGERGYEMEVYFFLTTFYIYQLIVRGCTEYGRDASRHGSLVVCAYTSQVCNYLGMYVFLKLFCTNR